MIDAKKFRIIYEPQGRATEYVPGGLACNLAVGCPHGCLYCYGPGAMRKTRETFHAGAVPTKDCLAKLARDAEDMQAAGDERMTLFSFATDPYPVGQPAMQALTRAGLAIMAYYERPFTVLTKGGWAELDFNLYTPWRDVFATSIVWSDDLDGLEWEPYAGPVPGRWTALREAGSLDIGTWISVEPVIDPAQALDVIRRAADEGVGHVKIGPLNHHPLAKTIDYAQFGEDLAKVLEETGIDYYLKHDLRPYMPEGFACSTIETEEAGI